MDYNVIRSRRKTVGLEIRPDGAVLVRAPWVMSDDEIAAFVRKHEDWILKHRAEVISRAAQQPPVDRLSRDEIEQLADQALKVIPERVAYYAPRVGVTYGRITIRNQRTRWGSCSAKGNLNFNCLLMLTPPEVIDSVVVHELCHRLEMNHSDRFYAHVLRVYPDYFKWHDWLRKNGEQIMRRMTG